MNRKIRIYYDNEFIYTTLEKLCYLNVKFIPGKARFNLCTMQKDKNGVDIYEGDIIKAKHFGTRYRTENNHRIVWSWLTTGGIELFEVRSPSDIELLRPCPARGFKLGGGNNKKFEVVGNCYENPKLIASLSK